MHKIKTGGKPGVCPRLHMNRECSQKCIIRSIPKSVCCSPRALVSLEDMQVGRLGPDTTIH